MATTKTQTEAAKAAEKAAKEAAERAAAIAKIDADFREEVKAAGDKRAKALEKYPDLTNYAEIAWNETKAEADPVYAEVSLPYRQTLDAAVEAIKTTGHAGIAGLEAFEARVFELIEDEKPEEPTVEIPPGPPVPGGRPAIPRPSIGVHDRKIAVKKGHK